MPFIPKQITPNRLTGIAFISSMIAAYLYSTGSKELLIFINIFILLNWFGDSFDGRVAVYRKIEQPYLGFYLDHILDAFSIVLCAIGLTISNMTDFPFALGVAIIFILFTLHSAIEAVIVRRFSISFGMFGPTELRIGIILVNSIVFYYGESFYKQFDVKLFDLVALLTCIFASALLLWTVISNIKNYYSLEKTKINAGKK